MRHALPGVIIGAYSGTLGIENNAIVGSGPSDSSGVCVGHDSTSRAEDNVIAGCIQLVCAATTVTLDHNAYSDYATSDNCYWVRAATWA